MPKVKKIIETEAVLETADKEKEEVSATPTAEDIAKSKIVEENSKDLAEDDEARLRSSNPAGRFIVIELKGDRFRVASKRKTWVSPMLDYSKATRLAIAMNRRDPEQKAVNASVVRSEGGAVVSGWQEN